MKKNRQKTIFELFEKNHKTTLENLNRLYDALHRLRYEGKMNTGKNLSEIRTLTAYFKREMIGHMKQEERVLFPFLCTHIPRLQPMLRLLSADHKEFRDGLAGLEKNIKTGKADLIAEQGTYIVCLLSSHMWVESHSLYKAADKELRLNEKRTLIRRMKAGRKPA